MATVASNDLSDCPVFEASRRACCGVAVPADAGVVVPPEAELRDAALLDAAQPAARMTIPPIAMASDGTRVTREYTEDLRSGPRRRRGQVCDYVAPPAIHIIYLIQRLSTTWGSWRHDRTGERRAVWAAGFRYAAGRR